MKKKVKYNPAFPIKEIERANTALEKSSAIIWRRETHSVKTWREKVAITELKIDSKPYNQHDGDVYTVLSNGKTNYEYLLEIKHQKSFEPKGDFYEIVVTEKWLDRGKDYPRLGFIVGLPLENCLYYCHTLKSKISRMIEKGTKLPGGGVKIRVHKSLFVKLGHHWNRKDVKTWQFRQSQGILLYGKKQNYFEVEEEVVASISYGPIDKLIERKKRQVSELEAEIAKLEEFALTRKLLSDKYGEEIVG